MRSETAGGQQASCHGRVPEGLSNWEPSREEAAGVDITAGNVESRRFSLWHITK